MGGPLHHGPSHALPDLPPLNLTSATSHQAEELASSCLSSTPGCDAAIEHLL